MLTTLVKAAVLVILFAGKTCCEGPPPSFAVIGSLQLRELQLDKSEWSESQPVLLRELVAVATRLPHLFTLQRVSASGVQYVAGGSSNWHWDCFVQQILPAVAKHISAAQAPIYLLINSFDEPVSQLDTCNPQVLRAHGNIFGRPDRLAGHEINRLPIFSPCKVRGCHKDWLYPYGEICDPLSVPVPIDIPWELRNKTLFWRGSTTGFGKTRRSLLEGLNHRVRVIRALRKGAAERPDLSFDVGFTDFVQNVPKIADLASPWVDFKQWTQFKFILDMGGNSYSRRLILLAHLKSAVILNNPFQDLFSRSLVNGTHALISDVAGSDIISLYESLLVNDEKGKRMGRALYRHMKRHFNFDSLVSEMTAVIKAYADSVIVLNEPTSEFSEDLHSCAIREADAPPWMREFWRKSPGKSALRVAFVTLTRDRCEKLQKNICQINSLLQHIAEAKVFVLEDNSQDCTVEILRKWASNAPVDYISIVDGALPADHEGALHPSRFSRMALLRSRILRHALAWNPDVVVVYDSDLTRGYAEWAVIDAINAIGQGKYDALCANDVMPPLQWRHYDSLALRFEWGRISDNMLFSANGSKFDSNRVRVRACFGGLAVYNASVFKSCGYEKLDEEAWDCEHVLLSRCLEREGRSQFLLPNLVVVVPYGPAP